MGLPGYQNQFVLDLKKCHWTFPLWKKGPFKSRFCGLFIPRLTGGHKTAQWVIPCPDPNKKCSKKKPTGSISTTPDLNSNGNNDSDDNNPNVCVSEKLAVGLYAQASHHDLLMVRSEPFTESVMGHIAPLAVINIIDGPKCAGGVIWWEVWGLQTGWAVESNLRACPKEGDCDPWGDE